MIPPVQKFGRYEAMGRDLFVLSLPTSEDFPQRLGLPSRRFVCCIAWDARAATASEISALARRLLDAGAVFICAWGPDCERVHDIIYEEDVASTRDCATKDSFVLTTWHDDGPLWDVLASLLTAADPFEAYELECGAILGISIGSPVGAQDPICLLASS